MSITKVINNTDMTRNSYEILNRFEYLGETRLIVKMDHAVCVMTQDEYNGICILERKWKLRNKIA